MFDRPFCPMKSGNKQTKKITKNLKTNYNISDRCEKIILLFEQLDEMFVAFCCGDDDGNAMYDCVH